MEEITSIKALTKEEEYLTPAEQWRRYMDLKKSKLLHQINAYDIKKHISGIFEGISIYVNGYTDPPASELRRLIQIHGGEFHIYYEYGTTTYTVATHVATGKINKLRKNEKIIHPKWIVDSIEAGERLPEEAYLIYKNTDHSGARSKFVERDEVTLNAATDPNFINNFYGRSRLHLISTLAQEMRQYVSELRNGSNPQFISRQRLLHLVCECFESPPEETICHVDLDCFFVSVALRTRPDLIGKPVAITHSRGLDASAGMSEVASCSYEARAYGVRNGCYVRQAKSVCPDLICLPYQFEDYRAISKLIYEVISRYTLDIRAVSCDEMYVDLNSLCSEMRIMDVMGVVSIIREEIHAETQCNASVGVGPSMLIARLSTRHAKPNGQFVVKCAEVENFMRKERISNLPGTGYNIRAKLNQTFGEMELCEELQTLQVSELQQLLGTKTGLQIYNLCRGVDKERDIVEKSVRKSISCNVNYGIRFNKENEMLDFLKTMAIELEKKLRNAHMAFSTVTLKVMIRAADAPMEPEKFLGHGVCDTVTRSAPLLKSATSADIIFKEAKKLMSSINPVVSDLRGVGIQLTRLSELQGKAQSHRVGHTLVDFFAVRTKGTRSLGQKAKHLSEEDDPILKKVLKESLREETNRKTRLLVYGDRRSLKPCYHNYIDDIDVKREMCRVLENFPAPTKEETQLLTSYFYHLAEYGNWSEVCSQLRFFERKAMRCSHLWLLVVAAIRSLLNELCLRINHCYIAF
uniref:DNA repair protein REV1 n=1 Tax=Ascaris lumbricoides TaxID=6252 RepID=A0A9J2PK98_ASCLU